MNLPAEKAFVKLVALGYTWNNEEWVEGTKTEVSADSDGWITWSGGKQPVDDDTEVEVRLANGKICMSFAESWFWNHIDDYSDIVAYRIRKQ